MALKNKKGISELSAAGLGIGVFVIILTVVAIIVAQLQTQTTQMGLPANNTAYNITVQGLSALFTLAQFLGIIAVTIVAGYIIFVVVRAFRFSGGDGGGSGV